MLNGVNYPGTNSSNTSVELTLLRINTGATAAAAPPATLTVTGGGNFSGDISGTTTALTLTGGTLTLSGVNDYTGTTTVNGGTLHVTGSIASPQITVNSPGAFIATVVNTNDSGPGSLRQAITETDDTTGVTPTINFNIPGGGVQTISLASALPAITAPVILDGYTQPGASANTLSASDNAVLQVVINGAGVAASDVAGLFITSSDTTVEGLVVNGFNNSNDVGIAISGTGATGNVVSGDFIGTNAAGTAAVPNAGGVAIENGAQYNTVGGTTAGAANVISGNTLGGAGFIYAGTSYNVIEGNLLGLNAAGTAAIGNGDSGAFAIDGASNDTIGGTTAAAPM